MQEKSLLKNVILNVINTVANVIFPLITYPYVARVISASGMGKVTFFSSISGYATMLAALGIGTYGIRAIARTRDDMNKMSETAIELLSINILSTSVVVLLLFISYFFVSEFNQESILFLINLITIISAPFGMEWLFIGLEEYSYITRRNIFFKTITVILVFCFVRNADQYTIYAAITALSSVGTCCINSFLAKKYIIIKRPKLLSLKKHMKPMFILFASILAVSVYTNLDTIMLGFINGNTEVGYYGMATKIETILLTAINAISAALLPRLSNYIGKNDIDKYNLLLEKSVSTIFLITIPIATYFILEANDSIHFLGGSGYDPAISSMQILMPILVISGFSNVTGNQILIPKKKDSQFMIAIVSGAVIDLLLNLILMPELKAVGASVATLLAELVQMSVQLFYARVDVVKNLKFRPICLSLLASGLSAVMILILRSNVNLNSFLNLLLTSFAFFVTYILMLILFKEEYIMELLKNFLKKKSNV